MANFVGELRLVAKIFWNEHGKICQNTFHWK